jgi:hypothetical protein
MFYKNGYIVLGIFQMSLWWTVVIANFRMVKGANISGIQHLLEVQYKTKFYLTKSTLLWKQLIVHSVYSEPSVNLQAVLI